MGTATAVAPTPTATPATAAAPKRILTPGIDRCKVPTKTVAGEPMPACNAEAFYRVRFEGDIDVYYCNHHYVAKAPLLNRPGTKERIIEIVDEYRFINKAASPSS